LAARAGQRLALLMHPFSAPVFLTLQGNGFEEADCGRSRTADCQLRRHFRIHWLCKVVGRLQHVTLLTGLLTKLRRTGSCTSCRISYYQWRGRSCDSNHLPKDSLSANDSSFCEDCLDIFPSKRVPMMTRRSHARRISGLSRHACSIICPVESFPCVCRRRAGALQISNGPLQQVRAKD
jgi:hypothetical protein